MNGIPAATSEKTCYSGNECSKWQQESQTMKALEFQFLL